MKPISMNMAGDLLSSVADRLRLPGERAPMRAVLTRACGGQLDARWPNGRRASTLTVTGTPLELSVTGGGGKVLPAVRYVTETETQETTFAARVYAQLAAIEDLVTWLPNGGETTVGMLQSFVSTLYPDPAAVPKRFRSPTWLGVVHHHTAPQHIARLKVYAGLQAVPGALDRLCKTWPGFADLTSIPDGGDDFFVPVGAGLEVDATGHVNHKIYVRTRHRDAAVPMKLVQRFGDSAWELLSEFIRCGLDAATLHRHPFIVCCTQDAGTPVLGMNLMTRRNEDLTRLIGELAQRHHGSFDAVDALVRASESCGATWSYSAVGLSFSATSGVDKLNIYGVPTWETAPTERRYEGERQQSSQPDEIPETSVALGSKSAKSGCGSAIGAMRAVDAACVFLVDRQDNDGHWRDYDLPGVAESWATGCVGFVLRSAAGLLLRDKDSFSAVDKAVAVLRGSQRAGGWGYHRRFPCDADSTSWVVRLLALCEPESAVKPEILTPYLTSSWGVRTYPIPRGMKSWVEEHDEVAPMTGLALLAAGDDTTVERIRQRCVLRYEEHGGWLRFWWQSDSYAVAHNLTLLSRTGGIPPHIIKAEQERLEDSVDEVVSDVEGDEMSAFDIAHRLISAVRLDIPGLVDLLGRELLYRQGPDGSWESSLELVVPETRTKPARVFADHRRLMSTAVSVLALLEAQVEV